MLWYLIDYAIERFDFNIDLNQMIIIIILIFNDLMDRSISQWFFISLILAQFCELGNFFVSSLNLLLDLSTMSWD